MGQVGDSDLLETVVIAKSRLWHMHVYLYILWHHILSYVTINLYNYKFTHTL